MKEEYEVECWIGRTFSCPKREAEDVDGILLVETPAPKAQSFRRSKVRLRWRMLLCSPSALTAGVTPADLASGLRLTPIGGV